MCIYIFFLGLLFIFYLIKKKNGFFSEKNRKKLVSDLNNGFFQYLFFQKKKRIFLKKKYIFKILDFWRKKNHVRLLWTLNMIGCPQQPIMCGCCGPWIWLAVHSSQSCVAAVGLAYTTAESFSKTDHSRSRNNRNGPYL